MEKEEFEKTIKFEELAKTDDYCKFMLKSYLSCLLAGGKIWQSCFIYFCGRAAGYTDRIVEVLNEDTPLKFVMPLTDIEKESRKKYIIEFFERMKKEIIFKEHARWIGDLATTDILSVMKNVKGSRES